jgi:hypothetical protein
MSLNPYLKDWQSSFDYVLVLQPGSLPSGQALLADLLRPLKIADVCSLYVIRK